MRQDDELDATQKMFGDDFAELAHLFLGDSAKRMALLRAAIADQDVIAIGRLAHILCGSAASIGATALAALCGELETKVKNKDLGDVLLHLNTIESEYVHIHAKLHHMLKVDSEINAPGADQ